MAVKGLMRPGLIQVRVLDMQEALVHYKDRIGLYEVCREGDRVFLKGYDEFDHHSIVLRETDNAGLDFMAFKVDTDENLTRYTRRLNDYGIATDDVAAGDQPGIGRRVGFMLPTGHRIELFADSEMSDPHPEIENPRIWPVVPHGMGATRFDHALLYGPGIADAVKLLHECLDFYEAEYVEAPDGTIASWVTVSNKAHDLAFVEHEEPGKLHHVAFHLQDWSEVGKAADLITFHEISRDVGPTRHGITRGQTIYFFDPSGNRNEVFAGGYTYYPDNPTRKWLVDNLGRGIFYYEGELNDRFLSVLT